MANAAKIGEKQCFGPFSSWIHLVCWVPGKGVQVTFKNHLGVPYFTCYYPGTGFADYAAFEAAPSAGVHLHQKYFHRPYVPVALDA